MWRLSRSVAIMIPKTPSPITSVQTQVDPSSSVTAFNRPRVVPSTLGIPSNAGSWCTTITMPMPARNPAMIGSDSNSAIHPSLSSQTPATITPAITATIPTMST